MSRQSDPTGPSIVRTITERIDAQNEAAPEPNLTVGPCTCEGQVFIECDCGGCIGRHIECRPMDPWGDTAEPEGEPADIGEGDVTPRPFQVGDEVLLDGEPGVIAEMRDEAVRPGGVHAVVELTGFPFQAWDAVALTADRTRPVGGRLDLVRPAPTGRISSQAGLASIRHGVVQPDDTAAAVVTAALAWEESYDQPSGTHSAIRTGQLMGAVRAHRAALGGAS